VIFFNRSSLPSVRPISPRLQISAPKHSFPVAISPPHRSHRALRSHRAAIACRPCSSAVAPSLAIPCVLVSYVYLALRSPLPSFTAPRTERLDGEGAPPGRLAPRRLSLLPSPTGTPSVARRRRTRQAWQSRRAGTTPFSTKERAPSQLRLAPRRSRPALLRAVASSSQSQSALGSVRLHRRGGT